MITIQDLEDEIEELWDALEPARDLIRTQAEEIESLKRKVQTLEAIREISSIKKDLGDTIYDISPAEAPLHEWQEDTLEAPE